MKKISVFIIATIIALTVMAATAKLTPLEQAMTDLTEVLMTKEIIACAKDSKCPHNKKSNYYIYVYFNLIPDLAFESQRLTEAIKKDYKEPTQSKEKDAGQ